MSPPAEILRLLSLAIAAEHQASADWSGNQAAKLLEEHERMLRQLLAPLSLCRTCGGEAHWDADSVRGRSA